ncbi:MAG: GSCFA domain-containing protein [Chitinophagaceae bacterium]
MKFQLDIRIPVPEDTIRYGDGILLIGSCFTEHMSERLAQHRFQIINNPNGILFNPLSVSDSLRSYTREKQYTRSDLFYLNELWNSWDHHTRFSDVDPEAALNRINTEIVQAGNMLRKGKWLIITLGSAFQYYLKESNRPVANNHRAPGQWFDKRLLGISDIVDHLSETINLIRESNPELRILFTISPVRHIRDGVIENNRSKARLLEAVHTLCSLPHVYYFPAYELVIDILRDYRFYDIDMVHPNFAATQFVWEQFAKHYFADDTRALMAQVEELYIARNHRTRFPQTEAHRNFMDKYHARATELQQQLPFLDFSETIRYFASGD